MRGLPQCTRVELGGSGQLREVSEAARSAPASPGPPSLSDLLLDGLSLVVSEGRPAATPVLHEAVGAFRSRGALS